jgi:hypothetical protein
MSPPPQKLAWLLSIIGGKEFSNINVLWPQVIICLHHVSYKCVNLFKVYLAESCVGFTQRLSSINIRARRFMGLQLLRIFKIDLIAYRPI